MGIDDKANNAVTNHLGAAKEGAGKLTGNEQLEREGQQDQAKAQLQDAGEKIKDAAADVGGNLREAALKIKEGFSKN